MQYWETAEKASEIRARANATMEARGIAPTPLNYELWFFYELGQDQDLLRALDAALKNGWVTDQVRMREIHARFFSRPDERIEQANNILRSQLGQISNVLTDVNEGATDYGKALAATGASLKSASEIEDIRRLVDAAAKATELMEVRNSALKKQVEDSGRELDVLRTQLVSIRHESRVDALTSLANRRAFDEGLDAAISKSTADRVPLCLLMCDIDRFKAFNDNWGHSTGDQVLRLVASTLKTNTKTTDLAARYGGEELSVILPNTSLSDAVKTAERIRTAIETRKIVKKSTGVSLGQITISIGVAQYVSGEPVGTLLERADAHLYTAKQTGRNRVCWGAAAPVSKATSGAAAGGKKPRGMSPIELEFADGDTSLVVDAVASPEDSRLERLLAWWNSVSGETTIPVWKDEYLQHLDYIREFLHLHEFDERAGLLHVKFVGPTLIQMLGADPTGQKFSGEVSPIHALRDTAQRVFEVASLTRRIGAPLCAHSKTVRNLYGQRFVSEILMMPFTGKNAGEPVLLGATVYKQPESSRLTA